MKTIATMFSGGGGVECGAVAAGYTPIWGIELDAQIAKWHGVNFPDSRVIVAPVQDVDPMRLDRPDVLHASPPCPNFSVAKAGATETAEDISMAEAVCLFLRVLTPEAFTLENVQGYRQSQSYQRILCTLDELGYWTHSDVMNSADYGVPQTRKRLVLRASLNGLPAPLPSPTRWIGWYEAIEDLIPTLPESQFADWQLKRLPEIFTTFLYNPAHDDDLNTAEEPAPTMSASHECGKYRAFLVNESSTMEVREAAGSAASQVASERNAAQRAWLSQGRVVSMTPRALARFQSFPDSYLLPDNKTLAGKIIGNAVPPKLYQAVMP